MDTSDPEILFDSDGNCNHCDAVFNDKKDILYHGEASDKKLKTIVQKIKRNSRRKEYDCLVGISGGTDSSYLAYKVVKLGLRPLAVHLDNGWNSEEAVKNIKYLCQKINIDYETHVLDWERFKDIQLSVLKSSIVEVEIPTDIAIGGTLFRIAAKNNIKYIISGGNTATEGILPEKWFYDPKDHKLLTSIHKQFGKVEMKDFPNLSYWREIYYKVFKGIRMVYLLNYLPYNKKACIEELEREIGWKNYGGKHHENVFTKFCQSYIQPVKFNLDYRRATLSSQICNNEVTRDEAIQILKEKPYDEKTIGFQKEYVSKKLEITKEELEEIISSEPKSYQDYPNNEKRLKFIYGVYRKYFSNLFGEHG